MAVRKTMPVKSGIYVPSITVAGTATVNALVASANVTAARLIGTESGNGGGAGTLVAAVGNANGNPLVSWYTNSTQRWGLQGLGTACDSLRVFDYTGTAELMRWKTGSLISVFGATPVGKQTVSGSRGSNAALASLLTALAAFGWITDSTSA